MNYSENFHQKQTSASDFNYARGYLLHLATRQNLKLASNNLAQAIASQFIWTRFSPDFLAITNQKKITSNITQQDLEVNVDQKRYPDNSICMEIDFNTVCKNEIIELWDKKIAMIGQKYSDLIWEQIADLIF